MTVDIKCRPFVAYQHEVKAILEGKQTMFRRVIKPQPEAFHPKNYPYETWFDMGTSKSSFRGCYTLEELLQKCPYGQVGDRLWLKEIWRPWSDKDVIIQYKATPDDLVNYPEQPRFTFACGGYWRPSIHLPRWASRLTLEITDIKVERVQEISYDDAYAEIGGAFIEARARFGGLWDSINAKKGYGWDTNPYVFAPTFKVVS